MSRPTILLLSMDDAQQADVRLALKDVANVVRSKTPAELIADEYRNLNPGAAIVAVRPDAPNRFGLIHNVAAAGGVVIVQDPETAVMPRMPQATLERVPAAHALDVRAIEALFASWTAVPGRG